MRVEEPSSKAPDGEIPEGGERNPAVVRFPPNSQAGIELQRCPFRLFAAALHRRRRFLRLPIRSGDM
jgi:hypothetical protein